MKGSTVENIQLRGVRFIFVLRKTFKCGFSNLFQRETHLKKISGLAT